MWITRISGDGQAAFLRAFLALENGERISVNKAFCDTHGPSLTGDFRAPFRWSFTRWGDIDEIEAYVERVDQDAQRVIIRPMPATAKSSPKISIHIGDECFSGELVDMSAPPAETKEERCRRILMASAHEGHEQTRWPKPDSAPLWMDWQGWRARMADGVGFVAPRRRFAALKLLARKGYGWRWLVTNIGAPAGMVRVVPLGRAS